MSEKTDKPVSKEIERSTMGDLENFVRSEKNDDEKDSDYCLSEDLKSKDEKGDSESFETETPVALVLEPDHPMMQRFQIALKNHLLKQIDRLSNQVYELETDIKKKEKEKEDTGLELYTMQQEIFKQQKILEDCGNALETLMSERQSLDESVQSKKYNWKEEIDRLNSAKKKENEMLAELQKLSSLQRQMEAWEKEIDSELTVSQRISEKSQQDKKKLFEEKRKLDIYLLRLMTAVSNYEAEVRLLEGEIDVKIEEKDSLNQTLADATADLQALITEQKRLLSAWNSVVVTINQRNTIYANGLKELTQCQEAFRCLNAEIENYKRSSIEEMKKNEKLAIVYGRIENDKDNCEVTFKNLLDKKLVIENKISSTAAIIHQTEMDYDQSKIASEKLDRRLTELKFLCERINQDKHTIEEEIMNFLQDRIIKNKSAARMKKLLKETREKTRKQELCMLETENKISQKFLEVEELKELICQNNEIIDEMNRELNAREEELKKYEEEIRKCQTAIIQKQSNYANLSRKLENLMEKLGYGKGAQTQEQLRITELEKLNAEIQSKNDKMQNFWLLHQNNNVKLTQKRNDQLKDISLLRRQIFLLKQRVLKTDAEIQKEKKIENDLNRSICQLQHKLGVLNEVLIGKKDYKLNLGKENLLAQTQFVQNLKEAELEQIRLKAEIKELETNLEELAEGMLSTQREMLAWEKKIQSAVEAKNDIQKERSSTGEVGQMKAEIHRMEVRYSHLKKAQEKLISDLENCVLRRDAILDGVDAMERRNSKGFSTKFAIQKKMETIKNNIRAVCNEKKQIEKLNANKEEGHMELKKAIIDKEAHIHQMDDTTQKLNLKLEEKKLQKHQNLEMLIRRQKKCKMYDMLKNRRHRVLYRNEEVLDNELQKAKNTNINLISITEALITDFPNHRFQLKKIFNTFQAKPS